MSAPTRVGRPSPLGAIYDGVGVNFAVYSGVADRIELCLFDEPHDPTPRQILDLPARTHGVFHGHVAGLRPGQLYGYRAHGLYDPPIGRRSNPAKLLVDPYARAICGAIDWRAPVWGYPPGSRQGDLAYDGRDDAWGVPKGVVVDNVFDWEGDASPAHPWRDSVIYELHVKGFTIAHPEVPPELRGTYAGLGHPAVVAYLRELGVTAVELLPIHEIADDHALWERGLRNYWGYSTLGFFAPAGRYAGGGDRGQQVAEFRQMVKALHRAGIEVILDVVYNHTCEGNHLGPTLSLRGLDNAAYYRLVPGHARYYVDTSGCGNSLDVGHPPALRLVMDSLRYWVSEMHVDGFRFDLAPALARDAGEFDRHSRFLAAVHQDPVLSQVKLIAEPWDVGPGGYRLGAFPPPWAEWNGKYRDTARRFWRGDEGQAGEFATRLTGSSDVFGERGPQASVNFVTCHDGFTLHDLVSYARKHNLANGEDNRDGSDHEHSHNHGVEGPTDDPAIHALRERQKRNLLATLLLSQGVPMLLAGDELGRTQQGNNNAYCQDNPIAWVDWRPDPERDALHALVRRLLALRRAHPVLRRTRFFAGVQAPGGILKDVMWLRADGREMGPGDWGLPAARALGMLLGGDAVAGHDGRAVVGDTLLVLLNGGFGPLAFTFPQLPCGPVRWQVLVDTREPATRERWLPASERAYELCGRSLAVLRLANLLCETVPDPTESAR